MKKIISLFQRDYTGDRLVRNEVVPGAEWVLNGEGVATKKWDGTSCLIKDGKFYKRYDAQKCKVIPSEFIPAQDKDPITGHWPGWMPVTEDPSDVYHREAYNRSREWEDGTYELIGPKINGNREGIDYHMLVRHGDHVLINILPFFDGIKGYLKSYNENKYLEGIVWHHRDGRMVKIKHKDFFK